MKKVCIVTGTRAEYGLLKPVIDKIHKAQDLELQLVATGMHLSPEFGLTYKEIESDGYPVTEKVEMLFDYSKGIDNLPKSNVLKFKLESGTTIVVRPSGTEPKLKIYFSVQAEDKLQAKRKTLQYKKEGETIWENIK